MKASGEDQTRLTFSGRNNTTPEWSPNGDEIAFTGYTGTGTEVFITDLKGFIRRVTHCKGNCEDPSWSPDGNFMAFIEQIGPEPPQLFISPLFRHRYKTRITRGGGIYATPAWQR
jgi:TolB protein